MYKTKGYTSTRKTVRIAEHRETVRQHLSDGPLSWCGCKHCKGAKCLMCDG